jgi:hypothetical protein
MRLFAVLLLLLSVDAPGGEGDPPGTVSVDLEAGETSPVQAESGASVICDDPHLVAPEFTADGNGLLLRALEPGSTLCGVWLKGGKPGGLYRVKVRARKGEPKPAPAPASAGALNDGGT